MFSPLARSDGGVRPRGREGVFPRTQERKAPLLFPNTPPPCHNFSLAAFEQQKKQQRGYGVEADFQKLQKASVRQTHQTIISDEAKIADSDLVEIERGPGEHHSTHA
jgi:hypothetical protein